MWPCLVNEALTGVPGAAAVLWGLSKAVLQRELAQYQQEHKINPSPRVFVNHLMNLPEAQAILSNMRS
jgi:hypothetical protein